MSSVFILQALVNNLDSGNYPALLVKIIILVANLILIYHFLEFLN
jgi:hypothetical protein